MIYAGFDPAFIDINVRPLGEENKLIENLPLFGEHWPNTQIEFIPGGNGFNFCRTLASLGMKTTFVGPLNDFFVSLVKKLDVDIGLVGIKGAMVNYTAILNTTQGEIQFNSVQGELAPSLLSREILKLYSETPVKSISNVAFNPKAPEWISSLLLSLRENNEQLIFSNKTKIDEKLELLKGCSFEGIVFIDPSDISHYSRLGEFYKILKTLNLLEGVKYLSVNEFEMKALLSIKNGTPLQLSEQLKYPIILHTAEKVKLYQNGNEICTLNTIRLAEKKTFVGAGDVFNGAFIFAILNNYHLEDALQFAIKAASFLIEKGVFPSSENLK